MKHYLWRTRAYYRQVAGLLLLGSASGIVCNIAVVLPAILLGRAIDAAQAMEQGEGTFEAVLRAAVLYVAGMALYFVARMGKRWWLRTAVRRTVFNVRNDALRGILSQPMEWLHQKSVGDLMARIIGDAEVFGRGFNESTTELWDTWLFSLSLLGAMAAYDAQLTFLVMIPVPIALLLSYVSKDWVRGRTLAVRLAVADLTTALQERLAGVRILRLFGHTKEATAKINDLSRRLEKANLAEIRLQVGLSPIYSFLITGGVVLLVWLGGERTIRGAMSVGSLIAFIQLYLRFVQRGHRLPLFFNRLQSASVAWDRLERLMVAPFPALDQPKWVSFKPVYIAGLYQPAPAVPHVPGGALSAHLKNVSFRYPGAASLALDGVSLEIPAASFIAITGPIGSGKSALLRVIMGLYAAGEGQVEIGGRCVEDIPAAERAIRMRYVPQEADLFSGTVSENIGLSSVDGEGAQQILRRVIAVASLEQDVRNFPAGLETQIGEIGIQVSGGQRQRIALARALAVPRGRSPGMLLLDDPFASVDVGTEARIIRALRDAFGSSVAPDKQSTIVLCSHRLTAFEHADVVLVLDEGRIVAQGSHEELLAAGGLYARICVAQHRAERAMRAEAMR